MTRRRYSGSSGGGSRELTAPEDTADWVGGTYSSLAEDSWTRICCHQPPPIGRDIFRPGCPPPFGLGRAREGPQSGRRGQGKPPPPHTRGFPPPPPPAPRPPP